MIGRRLLSVLPTIAGLLLALVVPFAFADEPPSSGDKKPTAKPKDDGETKPVAKPSKPAAKPTSAEYKEFEGVYKQWKDVLAKLSSIQSRYPTASVAQRTALEEEFRKVINEAAEMTTTLRKSAEAAYVAEEGRPKDLERLLLTLAATSIQEDDFDEAARLAAILRRHESELPALVLVEGIAAFVLNDYATAKTKLTAAQDVKIMNDMGKKFLDRVDTYPKMWAREKKLRDAEAKADDLPRVKLETSKGTIVVELFENEAPNTVANFITLVESKFYNGTKFHRVETGFMAQGGDPKGTGQGGPGYAIPGEESLPNHREHFRGSLSMAHQGDPNTGGSQFFLTFIPTQGLDGKHTVFGRIIEGMDVLAKLQKIDPTIQNNTIEADKIIKAEVIRKREHEYKVKKVGD